jgi:PTS system N-acetylglucosamine-specific IIC component
MVVMDVLGVRLGFGFSAGLFDYLLNYGKSTQPLLMLPVGLLYAAVYYVAFRWVISRLNLPTPGREPDEAVAAPVASADGDAAAYLAALGGSANVRTLDACMTRLRVTASDAAAIDEAALKRLGARGIVRPTADTVQVVVGPVADQLAARMRSLLRAGEKAPRTRLDPERLLAALGGDGNIASVDTFSTRLVIAVADPARVDESGLDAAAPRGYARPSAGSIHVLADADDIARNHFARNVASSPR